MSQPRDFQRQKVYNAERDCSFRVKVEWTYPAGGRRMQCRPTSPVLTLNECREYIDMMVLEPPFTDWREGVRHVTVIKGRQSALGYYYEQKIALPEWARTELTSIHELCHLAVNADYFPSHGAEFCGLELQMVRKYMGDFYADELQEKFDNRKVRYLTEMNPSELRKEAVRKSIYG